MSAGVHPRAVALLDERRGWTFAEMQAQAEQWADRLREQGVRVMATLLDNSPAWVIADAAALRAGVVHVPLPGFFTPEQVAHALSAAGVELLLTLPAVAARWPALPASPWQVADTALVALRLPSSRVPMPAGTVKVTFTSGTTGTPKGVCLSGEAMAQVAEELVQAMAPLDIRRHLCALPFAVLLENVAGLAAPLRRGASCVTLPLHALGLTGSSSFDAARFHATVAAHRPDSLILLPQMLRAWVAHLAQQGMRAPDSLKLVAAGGAAVGARLLQSARALGIPAFEGYGLSEGASVQTLNLPGADRPGSVGRPLPHARLRVAADGEIEVSGSLFCGYLGRADPVGAWWPTGDLGHIDADGFLHIEGRKKNVLITAFGRNVSPEWVETALRSESSVLQAVVLGEGLPSLRAVLWPVHAGIDDRTLQGAVDATNRLLPDYAQIHGWVRAQQAFSAETGMATANGRPQRSAVLQRHAQALGLSLTETA